MTIAERREQGHVSNSISFLLPNCSSDLQVLDLQVKFQVFPFQLEPIKKKKRWYKFFEQPLIPTQKS